MPSPTAGPADLHLWQIAAARDLIIFFGVAFSLWVVYRLGDIFLPVFWLSFWLTLSTHL